MLLILRIMQGFGAGAERGRCDGVMKVLLPDSMILDPHLPGGVEAVVYDASSAIPDEHLDAEVLVTWAVPALSGRLDDDPAGRQCAHLGVWNVIITPLSAGGRPLGADELIIKNVTALAYGGNFENKL
ncbi:MAG: phosphoglycerate dehydrogenase [Cutibacterium avidum]|nr:phosphoglycerate dehydrogenase [Cutibacterium avidum]